MNHLFPILFAPKTRVARLMEPKSLQNFILADASISSFRSITSRSLKTKFFMFTFRLKELPARLL